MSGGHFNYKQNSMRELIQELEEIDIESLELEDEENFRNIIHSTIDKLKTAYVYVNSIDKLICGDYGEETFNKRLKEDLDNTELEYFKY